MRIVLLLLFLLLLGIEHAYSQTWRRVGNWGNEFTDIVWVNEEVGYIAGDNLILKSIDGGLSWQEQEAPTDHRMLSLDFFDEENGLIVGMAGTGYRTSDGGRTWEVVDFNIDGKLNSVTHTPNGHIYVGADGGLLFNSTDGGLTWSQRKMGTEADLNAIFFVNPDSGYIASANSEIIRTENGGSSWQISHTGFDAVLNDLHFTNDTVGYAVGDLGTIIKTEDAGRSWRYINSGMDRDFNKVVFSKINPMIGLVTGSHGTILRTTNGGLTFATVTSRTTHSIQGVNFKANTNQVDAVAAGGVLISSTNAGGRWTLRMSGRANDYTGVQFVTDLRGYVIGQNGLILLTGNGGTSFTDRSRPLSLPFNALYFTGNNTGYVSGNNGNIISTTNSGGSWTALNPGTNRHVYGMYFFDINRGYVVGSRGYIARTNNRGVNWETVAPGTGTVDFRDIGFFDDDHGIIIGEGGWISRSKGGSSWDRVSVPSMENLRALKILDETTAIAVGRSGTLLKTSDQGRSWRQINVDYTRNFNDVEFLDESVGFVVGDKGLVLKTSDAGETWERVITGTFQNFTGISFGDLSTGYAVGENGTFFKYSCLVPETISAVFGEDNICLSQQVYTVQESVDPGVTYEWRVDGGTVLEGQGTSRAVIRWDSPGRNAVIVRGQNNCGNGIPAALEVLVSVPPDQTGTIEGNGAVCLDAMETYAVDSVPGTSYVWETRGGIVRNGQGTSTVMIEWTSLSQQSLRVIPTNPCGEGEAIEKTIVVQDAPAQPSEIEGPGLVGFEVVEYSLEAVSGVNYQWSAGAGGTIVGGQGTGTVSVSWQNEGNFELTATPMNGCDNGPSRSFAVKVDLITGIGEEGSHPPAFNVYPNPSAGDVTVYAENMPGINEVSIFNVMGQRVHYDNALTGKKEFHIHNLPKGLLMVVLRGREKDYVKMIMVR